VQKSREPESVEFLGLNFDASGPETVLARLIERPADQPFAYLVTPNVDHMVRLHDDQTEGRDDIWRAYEEAAWRSCDSRVLSRLAKWRNLLLPVVTGSDLTRALLEAIEPETCIAVIGGPADLPARLGERFPNLVVRQHRAPMGLLHNITALGEAVEFAIGVKARFTLIAVGSPQQELLAHAIQRRPGATGVGLCIGASLDFLIGEQVRAPLMFQRAGLEWLFRLASNPRRFWRRYLVEGPRIFQLWWRAGSPAGRQVRIAGAAPAIQPRGRAG
jgi:N-acetylglucosaminyldiphosphoundecaprenol N-acetyl-beta-D-mannosaminyltransferase